MPEETRPLRRRMPAAHPHDDAAALLERTYRLECRRHAGERFGWSMTAGLGGADAGQAAGAAAPAAEPFGPTLDQRRAASRAAPRPASTKRAARQQKRLGVWRALARDLAAVRIDPTAFVRAQFVTLEPGRPPPAPETLQGPEALRRYQNAPDASRAAVRAAFITQMDAYRKAVSVRHFSKTCPRPLAAAQDSALNDESRSMSPLFRFAMATALGLAGTADRFEAAAAVQYTAEADAYDLVWKQALPAGWRDRAVRLYEACRDAAVPAAAGDDPFAGEWSPRDAGDEQDAADEGGDR